MERETTYCCDHHVDIAFDDFLVDNETFPYLVNITSHKCTYCNKEATYALKLRP